MTSHFQAFELGVVCFCNSFSLMQFNDALVCFKFLISCTANLAVVRSLRVVCANKCWST